MIDIETILTYLTLISVPIGVVYHILTLRNQTRTRQFQIIKGANIFGDFVWKLYSYDVTDVEDFVSKFNEPDSQIRKDYLEYFSQLEELGVYLREGLLDIRYIMLLSGGGIIQIYEKYEPVHDHFREHMGSRWMVEAEYLYDKLKEYIKQHPELAT